MDVARSIAFFGVAAVAEIGATICLVGVLVIMYPPRG
jgi:drug/metabolite transporter superfamily protein YnfA